MDGKSKVLCGKYGFPICQIIHTLAIYFSLLVVTKELVRTAKTMGDHKLND